DPGARSRYLVLLPSTGTPCPPPSPTHPPVARGNRDRAAGTRRWQREGLDPSQAPGRFHGLLRMEQSSSGPCSAHRVPPW
uniref:Uncharacterized protein n=1 Tax=Nothoprocta perdicaria TaxID=30464 RepID=A0A8C6ZMW6_NOTPE